MTQNATRILTHVVVIEVRHNFTFTFLVGANVAAAEAALGDWCAGRWKEEMGDLPESQKERITTYFTYYDEVEVYMMKTVPLRWSA